MVINDKARHNLINAKYQQMAFRSVPTTLLFEIWSNKSDAKLEGSDWTVECCYLSQFFIKNKLPALCCKMAAKCFNSLGSNFIMIQGTDYGHPIKA